MTDDGKIELGKGPNGEGLEIGTRKPGSGDVRFYTGHNGSNEVLHLKENGDILVQGRMATNDKEVTDAVRLWAMNLGWPFTAPFLSARPVNGRIRPNVDKSGVPKCAEECPSHDGKRCEILGYRPDAICEPAVREMAARLT